MEKVVLKLEETDDITTIRSRIDFALVPSTAGNGRVKRLLLVAPRKNKALQSLVNMKLLARAAQTRVVICINL